MFFHEVNEVDFIELLGALPHSPAVTRAHLLGAFDVIVASDDPRAWWNALVMDRDEEGAAKAVAQLIISKGGGRLVSLIRAEAAGRHVVARADDTKPTRLLFDSSLEGFLVDQEELRSIVCEYYEKTQVVLEDDGWLFLWRSQLAKGGRRLEPPVVRNRLNELGDVESRHTGSQGRPIEYRFVAPEGGGHSQ